jgi:hypothetical protein
MTAPLPRAARRRNRTLVNRYQRKARGSLITTLIEAGDRRLDSHPHAIIFRRAISEACGDPAALSCITCGAGLTNENPFGAFLVSCSAIRPTIASCSTVCLACWRQQHIEEIEHHAARVLRRIVPRGAFLGPLPERKSPLGVGAPCVARVGGLFFVRPRRRGATEPFDRARTRCPDARLDACRRWRPLHDVGDNLGNYASTNDPKPYAIPRALKRGVSGLRGSSGTFQRVSLSRHYTRLRARY